MTDSEPKLTVGTDGRPTKKQASLAQRTRLRDTAVSLAFFAALLWLMSQSAFA